MPVLNDGPAVRYLGFPTGRDAGDSFRLLFSIHKSLEQINQFSATSEFGYVGDDFSDDSAPTSTHVGRGKNRVSLNSVNPAGTVQNI